MKFRKKPVVIEAEQWNGSGYTHEQPRGVCWCHQLFERTSVAHVHTIHGNQAVKIEPGDWIVPEPDGEHFYPVKPDIFEMTYEPAD